MPELGQLLEHGEAAPSASAGPAALQERLLEDKALATTTTTTKTGFSTRTARRARHGGRLDYLYVGSGLELKHKKNGKIVLPWGGLF